MEFSEDILEQLKICVEDKELNKVCIDLGIIEDRNTNQIKLEKIKEYISENLLGKIRGKSAIIKFLTTMHAYKQNNELVRISNKGNYTDGFVDYNLLLPLKDSSKISGFRTSSEVLGEDRNRYILKDAEGLKGITSGMNNAKDAKFNPTIAYAFFKYLGEDCAEFIPALEKQPYFYILSKNFLKKNQEIISLDNENFTSKPLHIDEEKNITHSSILDAIENHVKEKGFSKEKTIEISEKLKLQYVVQETIKSLICNMDENLGNTSFISTKDKEGNIADINISPAYDLDISFALGEEMQKSIGNVNKINRVTKDGKNDLKSIIQEFELINGYKEKMQEIMQKFQNGYIDKIFNIAYEFTKIEIFKSKELKQKYSGFLMRRIALFKEACKEDKEKIFL